MVKKRIQIKVLTIQEILFKHIIISIDETESYIGLIIVLNIFT